MELLKIMAKIREVLMSILFRKSKYKRFLYFIVLTIQKERMITIMARINAYNFSVIGCGWYITAAARSIEAEGTVNPK